MEYVQVTLTCLEEYREILIAELAAIGFDSFLETETGIEGYVLQEQFSRDSFDEVISTYRESAALTVVEGVLPKVNWNEEWEKNYDPIEVGKLVYVRASFHSPQPGFQYEIVINPKMSFGTGHHATTFQLLSLQGNIDHQGKRVLDVGSGTGILAIMAHLLGAKEVEAFDIDSWCVDNGNENFELNGLSTQMGLGTIREVKPKGPYELILANINKNVLLDELAIYTSLLAPQGILLLSGFYSEDIDDLNQAASLNGLRLTTQSTKDNWAALEFQKN
ncbi:MAG: 50S ribosomal protein L11 methyltransferase [Algoriphagus sp.]|uniref:50S ribosomal protein L11 methyltransferase n=1 Tax=Algoriphagus sp. TaxID=1872435 RepID=UPI00275180CD|nr:50S ribosomal protein L11 methyltransferase [Algoriphagus sp.]MDP4838855.1 50S ribosomal protein L11 methyltransferase [Algoriphagus sp.]MDP4904484.1 50S ribosomal protein L11 methyltransferase [Algoriphagus sp.]MDP4957173.1 50S ribosomal protein L11 methyltransferase [Algoriphagus sp.]MDP5125695.1 50S ribosomal protein L11 methyltransferase [Algoriphagus sp.]